MCSSPCRDPAPTPPSPGSPSTSATSPSRGRTGSGAGSAAVRPPPTPRSRPSTSPATRAPAAPSCRSSAAARAGCRRTSATACCPLPAAVGRRRGRAVARPREVPRRAALAGVRPAPLRPGRAPRSARRCAPEQPRPRDARGTSRGRADGVHGRDPPSSRRRLAGQPDPDVAGLAVGGARRRRLARRARTRSSPTCSTGPARPTGWAGSGRSAPGRARPTASAAGRSRSARRGSAPGAR